MANARGLDCSNAEVLNSLTLINNDNTKTLFSYEEAIKYIDSDGYIRFIDNSLKSVVKAESIFEWYTFENTAGNVKQYFPVSVATGIRIESEGYTVRLIPHTLLNNAELDNGGNRADKFLSYIGFDEVKSAVFNTLVIIPLNTEIEALTQANQDGSKTDQIILLNMLILDEQYHWSVVKTKYHDTYLFLRSLEGRLSEC